MTKLMLKLVKAITEHPVHVSCDDDMSTDAGVIQTAIYVMDRMQDELDAYSDHYQTSVIRLAQSSKL